MLFGKQQVVKNQVEGEQIQPDGYVIILKEKKKWV